MWEEIKWALAKSALISVLALGPFIYHLAYETVQEVEISQHEFYLDVE